MSDLTAKRKAWRSSRKAARQQERRYWNEHCDWCGYKRKHHWGYHTRWVSDPPGAVNKPKRACQEFKEVSGDE